MSVDGVDAFDACIDADEAWFRGRVDAVADWVEAETRRLTGLWEGVGERDTKHVSRAYACFRRSEAKALQWVSDNRSHPRIVAAEGAFEVVHLGPLLSEIADDHGLVLVSEELPSLVARRPSVARVFSELVSRIGAARGDPMRIQAKRVTDRIEVSGFGEIVWQRSPGGEGGFDGSEALLRLAERQGGTVSISHREKTWTVSLPLDGSTVAARTEVVQSVHRRLAGVWQCTTEGFWGVLSAVSGTAELALICEEVPPAVREILTHQSEILERWDRQHGHPEHETPPQPSVEFLSRARSPSPSS